MHQPVELEMERELFVHTPEEPTDFSGSEEMLYETQTGGEQIRADTSELSVSRWRCIVDRGQGLIEVRKIHMAKFAARAALTVWAVGAGGGIGHTHTAEAADEKPLQNVPSEEHRVASALPESIAPDVPVLEFFPTLPPLPKWHMPHIDTTAEKFDIAGGSLLTAGLVVLGAAEVNKRTSIGEKVSNRFRSVKENMQSFTQSAQTKMMRDAVQDFNEGERRNIPKYRTSHNAESKLNSSQNDLRNREYGDISKVGINKAHRDGLELLAKRRLRLHILPIRDYDNTKDTKQSALEWGADEAERALQDLRERSLDPSERHMSSAWKEAVKFSYSREIDLYFFDHLLRKRFNLDPTKPDIFDKQAFAIAGYWARQYGIYQKHAESFEKSDEEQDTAYYERGVKASEYQIELVLNGEVEKAELALEHNFNFAVAQAAAKLTPGEPEYYEGRELLENAYDIADAFAQYDEVKFEERINTIDRIR